MLSRKRIFFQTLLSVLLVMSLLGKETRAIVWAAWGFGCDILFLMGPLNKHSIIGEENSILLSTIYTYYLFFCEFPWLKNPKIRILITWL